MNTLELIPSAIYTGETGDTCYVSAIYNSSEMLGYDFQIFGITDHRQVIPTRFFFSLYPFTLGLWKVS